jgi:hypothetical protein
MKIRICLAVLSLSFFFAGCMFSSPLPRLWFYTYSSASEADGSLTPASFIELRPDGSYTRDFGEFDYGNWTQKDQQLVLSSYQHRTDILTLGNVTLKEMQLTLSKGVSGNFDGLPLPGDKASEDPFSVDNNRWRIHALHKESTAEIRHRLYNHCQFWEAYFKWALDKSLSSVDVRSTPTAIKIYGNGFGLKPMEELPAAWRAYFYDKEDCQRAHDIIQDIFEHKTLGWAHSDNKYKMFISAFQQMENFLR